MAVSRTTAVVGSVAGSFVLSYIFWDLTRNRKIFGGEVPKTLSKEWRQETERMFDEGWPREASDIPVVMNPIRRQNYRKVES